MSTATNDRTCTTLTTRYKDEQVLIIFISALIFGVALFILFLVLRFLLWEFGKQNVYHWGKENLANDYSESSSTLSDNTLTEYEVAREHSLFNWMRNYVTFGLKSFRKRVGVDAYLYQIFQLHLLGIMLCYVFVCMVIILAVNVGYCSRDIVSLSKIITTSISACFTCKHTDGSNSGIVWLHSVMTHILVVIGFAIGLNYRRILYRYEYKGDFHFNAIQIQHLPTPNSLEEAAKIKESISKHFTQTTIEEEAPTSIDFVYDVAKYDALNTKHIEAEKSLDTYQQLEDTYGVRQYIYTGLSRFVCWIKPVKAVNYYRSLIADLTEQKQAEKEKSLSTPQGMAIVGFRDGFDLLSVYRKYLLLCGRPKSTESEFLTQNRWWVSRAPAPTDINWANIRSSKLWTALWYFRWCLVNLGILILLLFFTTPTAVFYILNIIISSTTLAGNMTAPSTDDGNEVETLNRFLTIILGKIGFSNNTAFDAAKSLALAYAGPLLQILLASVIPLIVSYSSYLEFHWSKSDTMKASILKSYSFLLIMLLIFPSFSFASFDFLFKLILKNSASNNSLSGFTTVTSGAFSPDSGIFFMNYLNFSAFFVIIQMFRVPGLLIYLYRKLSARNEVESQRSHDGYIYIFKFGIEYAWVLVKISISIVYGTLFPLITLSGLLYLILKMGVDRYNLIYQARRVQEYSGRISVHLRALRFLHVSLVLSQIYILILSIILFSSDGASLGLLIFNSVMLILTIIALVGFISFRWFQRYVHDFRFSLRSLMTRSQEMHLIEAARYIERADKPVYNYFEFIEMDKTDTLSDEAKVV